MDSRRNTYLYIIILLPLIYFAIFLHLDSRPFRVWDEAYLGVHAYEMMHDHNYLVTHSFGSPEMSNTKPPFVIWCMTLSSSLFGFNELSIRLPNALAGVLICFIIFFFCTYILQSSFKGFLSVLILISSAGFIRLHVVRSGEYDAFLVLFVTTFSLSYFLILENVSVRLTKASWIVFTISLICAILTKGIAACLILPGLFIYTIFHKKLLWLLRSKEIYISIFLVLTIGIGYYILREHYNHGYIKAVYENELGGRYLQPMLQTSPWLYLKKIADQQFSLWLPFALIGIFFNLYDTESRNKRFFIFCTFIIIVLLIVLSAGATRLDWYDAPAFPFLALLASSGIYFTIYNIFRVIHNTSVLNRTLVAIFIILLVTPGYANVIISNLSSEEDPWDADSYNLTYYIEHKEKQGVSLNGYKIVMDWFMMRALTCQVDKWVDKGQKIETITNNQPLQKGDMVITNHSSDRQQLDKLYLHKCTDIYKNVETWKILGPQKQE